MRRSIIVKLLTVIAVAMVFGIGSFVYAQVNHRPLDPLTAEEAEDWGARNIRLEMATGESKISEEQAIEAAKAQNPALAQASSVKARYVNVQPTDGTIMEWNGNRWIIQFKGVHILGAGNMYGANSDAGAWYFDIYYIIVNGEDGSCVGGFSGPGKREQSN